MLNKFTYIPLKYLHWNVFFYNKIVQIGWNVLNSSRALRRIHIVTIVPFLTKLRCPESSKADPATTFTCKPLQLIVTLLHIYALKAVEQKRGAWQSPVLVVGPWRLTIKLPNWFLLSMTPWNLTTTCWVIIIPRQGFYCQTGKLLHLFNFLSFYQMGTLWIDQIHRCHVEANLWWSN